LDFEGKGFAARGGAVGEEESGELRGANRRH